MTPPLADVLPLDPWRELFCDRYLDRITRIASVAAFQNGTFALLANRVGEEETVTFAGGSFAVGPEGAVLGRAGRLKEEVLIVDLDPARAAACPARRLFLPDRRPGCYRGLE